MVRRGTTPCTEDLVDVGRCSSRTGERPVAGAPGAMPCPGTERPEGQGFVATTYVISDVSRGPTFRQPTSGSRRPGLDVGAVGALAHARPVSCEVDPYQPVTYAPEGNWS